MARPRRTPGGVLVGERDGRCAMSEMEKAVREAVEVDG